MGNNFVLSGFTLFVDKEGNAFLRALSSKTKKNQLGRLLGQQGIKKFADVNLSKTKNEN